MENIFDVHLKVEYVRYIHNFLTERVDSRSKEIRDWLYKNSNNPELIYRIDVERIFSLYTESYPNLLSYKHWIRESKLNQLLN